MNADLTFNSIAYKKLWDDPDKGSARQSTSRGINLPDVLSVKNQDYVDTTTKLPGKQYLIRTDAWYLDSNNVRHKVSAYAVIQVPQVASSTDVATVVATFKAQIADANLVANVLNGEL